MNVTLDKFGRILIPKPIRRKLGLAPGEELRIEAHDQELILRPVVDEPALVEKDGLLVSTAPLEEEAAPLDLIEHIRATRGNRDRTSMGPGF